MMNLVRKVSTHHSIVIAALLDQRSKLALKSKSKPFSIKNCHSLQRQSLVLFSSSLSHTANTILAKKTSTHPTQLMTIPSLSESYIG